MAKIWSVSQQKFVETSDVPQGGVSSEIPSGMSTQNSGGGIDLRSIYSQLFQSNPNEALKQGSKFKAAMDIMQPEGSASDKQTAEKKKVATSFNKEMDDLLGDWSKMSILDRLPIPGVSRVSPIKARYETTRDLYNYMLITMVADKRITDEERKYFVKLFPNALSTKDVAKERVGAIKRFVNTFNEMPSSPTIETSQGTMSIDDLWQ